LEILFTKANITIENGASYIKYTKMGNIDTKCRFYALRGDDVLPDCYLEFRI